MQLFNLRILTHHVMSIFRVVIAHFPFLTFWYHFDLQHQKQRTFWLSVEALIYHSVAVYFMWLSIGRILLLYWYILYFFGDFKCSFLYKCFNFDWITYLAIFYNNNNNNNNNSNGSADYVIFDIFFT